ncbi:YciI family protein [Embleya sp. AB8]|uniref:YciI family protein n=1 Tax=Embleya sp. AB8 TaxID=3156304 RepID=UPI003C712350
MKFLLNVYLDPAAGGVADEAAFTGLIRQSGELVDGHLFADPATSAVVRVRDGVAQVSDGPYLDSGPYARGYYLLDCESLERAVELAALHPAARIDAVEVRPLMTSAGLEM